MTDRSEPLPSRAAVLTPAGRGAVAVVAAEGPAAIAVLDAAFRAANGRSFHALNVGRVALGRFLQEDVILCKLASLSAEVHCHGGRAAAQRILDRFEDAGCKIVGWGDWTSSVEATPDVGLNVAGEARCALAQAATSNTAAILLDQLQGAALRAAEDFAARIGAGDHAAAQRLLDVLRVRTTWGARLVEPPRVVVAGWPNVGKSSLINALVGYQRAIVFDQPGTTRDVLSAAAALNGWPVLLVDVAGLRSGAGTIESAGVELARRQMEGADQVLWVLDAGEIRDGSTAALQGATNEQMKPWSANVEASLATVVNKMDLHPQLAVERSERTIGVSALTGEGIEALADFIAERLFPETPPPGAAVPFTARQGEALQAAARAMETGHFQEAVARVREYAGGA